MLNCLPKSAQPAARRALAEIRDAEGRGHAEVAIRQFTETYQAKYPKAVAKIVDDREVLLTFYDFPPSSGSTCAPPTRSLPPAVRRLSLTSCTRL